MKEYDDPLHCSSGIILRHNLYFGGKRSHLFSQRLFHLRVCRTVLWTPFSCVNTNQTQDFVENERFSTFKWCCIYYQSQKVIILFSKTATFNFFQVIRISQTLTWSVQKYSNHLFPWHSMPEYIQNMNT